MAKKSSLGILYLVGMALIVLGFCLPMFSGMGINPNGFKFINFKNGGFVSIGALFIIIGGIANDKVILTVDLYFSGQISEEVALERLKFEQPNIQYCIRSQEMLDNCLKYIKSKRL